MTVQSGIFAAPMGKCLRGRLQVMCCFVCLSAYLNLHINVVLDLELDSYLHMFSVLQSIILMAPIVILNHNPAVIMLDRSIVLPVSFTTVHFKIFIFPVNSCYTF